jgi:hypothetical protein
MDPRRQIGRRDTEDWRNIHGGAAAEAVAAARKSVVMSVLMKRCLSVVVGVLLRAGLVVSTVQMKRGMGVAADESERQQQNQAAQEQGSLHGTSTQVRDFEFFPHPPIAQGRLKVKSGPVSASAGGPGGIGSQ